QLEVLARHAQHPLLWISDSNTRVLPHVLVCIVRELSQPGVGLVVSPVMVEGARTLGARLEALHMNAFVAANAVLCDAVAHRVVAPGKSALLRDSTLRMLGGFESLGRYLAE